MGGKSSSASSSSSKVDNSSKVADLSGNAGTAISAGNKSKVKISNKTTDHGAIKGAFDFISDFYTESFDFGRSAVDSVSAMAAAGQRAASATTTQIGELAETFRSDGESRTQKTVLMIAGLATLLAVVAGGAYLWSESNA